MTTYNIIRGEPQDSGTSIDANEPIDAPGMYIEHRPQIDYALQVMATIPGAYLSRMVMLLALVKRGKLTLDELVSFAERHHSHGNDVSVLEKAIAFYHGGAAQLNERTTTWSVTHVSAMPSQSAIKSR